MTVKEFMEKTDSVWTSSLVSDIYNALCPILDASSVYRIAHPKKYDTNTSYLKDYQSQIQHLLPSEGDFDDVDFRRRVLQINQRISSLRIDQGRERRKTLKQSLYLERTDANTRYFKGELVPPYYFGYKMKNKTWSRGISVCAIDTGNELFEAESIYDAIFKLSFVRDHKIKDAIIQAKEIYEKGLGDSAHLEILNTRSGSGLSEDDRHYVLSVCEKPEPKEYSVCLDRYNYLCVTESSKAQAEKVLLNGLLFSQATDMVRIIKEGYILERKVKSATEDIERYKESLKKSKAELKESTELWNQWQEASDSNLKKAYDEYRKH